MKEHVIRMLNLVQETVQSTPLLGRETGKLNAKGEISIEMDVKIEEVLIDYLEVNRLPVDVFSEERGTIKLHKNPEYLVVFDPLDGSTNYGLGKGILPFGALITFYQGINPKLRNIIASGAIECTNNLVWIYQDGNTTDINGDRVNIGRKWPINEGTPVYLDLFYKEGYEMYRSLPQKLSIRNTGSTVANLSLVLSGAAPALGGVCMRSEEVGAIYSLVKGAKGSVVDLEGLDLEDERFFPDKTYFVVGGNTQVVKFIIDTLNKTSV